MTAKNKDDFLYQLHHELHRIGVDNNDDIIADFEEHFRASAEQGLSEEQTCEKLGDVKEIARSYVDIESTAINSILANAIEDARPHVSLTKPGREYSASEPMPMESIREITPEHITEEQIPLSQPVGSMREFTPEHIAQEPSPDESTSSMRSFTPEHTAEEQPAPEAAAPVQEEPAAQPAPEQPKADDSHKAEIPPQDCTGKAKNESSFRFSDIKGMTPNLNIGKLIVQICLDLFLWSWLLPILVNLTIFIFGTVVGGIFGMIFNTVLPFHFLSRIFLGVALFSFGVLMILLGVQMVKWIIRLVKYIVVGHIKAVYDL